MTFWMPLRWHNIARIIWAFYRHRKEASEILSSGETETESDFWRIFTLGCLDIILTLPVGMINIVTTVLQQGRSSTPFVFYPGWTYIHSDWWPAYVPKNIWDNGGVWTRFAVHWDEWIDPFFSLLFFALFGLTRDARTQYSCLFWGSMKFFGVMPAPQKDKVTSTIEFHSAMNDLESSTWVDTIVFAMRRIDSLSERNTTNVLPEIRLFRKNRNHKDKCVLLPLLGAGWV